MGPVFASSVSRPLRRHVLPVTALVVLGLLVPLTTPASAAPEAAPTYVNPVSKDFADTFADPAVIRGKDGFWYSYGTSDPLREGESEFHRIPIARSTNLVDWNYVGDAFTTATLPRWADQGRRASIWAPDIRYVNGQYRMYYVVTETTVTPEPNDNAIGMATAPTPAGPWTDSGGPVVGPRRGGGGEPGNFQWTFDPSAVTDTDGTQWLLYGSYYGGVHVTKLNDAGTRAEGTATQVLIDNKFEGAYVVRRGGYWYIFASTANCCAGPTTGYSVHVGRSRDLRGPYVDRDGVPLNQSRAGGTPTIVQNGNRWIGAGHNAVVTDLAGQDWVVYHAIRRSDPYLTGRDGINERPMLIDRLDWIRGWPEVRAGAGPSATRQRGPVTGGTWFTRFTTGIPRDFVTTGSWATPVGAQTGGYASTLRGTLLTRSESTGNVRVEADVRQAKSANVALVAGARRGRTGTQVVIVNGKSLRLEEYRGGRMVGSTRADIPVNFLPGAWHSLSLEIRGRTARAELSHARLGDPVAKLALRLSSTSASTGKAGVVVAGRRGSVDNLSVLGASVPVRAAVRHTWPDDYDRNHSDEFQGALKSGWTWVRQDPAATVRDGMLRWPTQAADLVGCGRNSDLNDDGVADNHPDCNGNTASVLHRDPGTGTWMAEAKLTIDLGTNTVRNFQQAGLIAYVNDDNFARLSHVAIWNTRQTEFGRELPYYGRTSYGGTIVGPPDATMWLRITHRVDASGEHELRAWSRRPGGSWVKGGVWTIPGGAEVRVGLVSHGGAGATAMFDYFRIYR